MNNPLVFLDTAALLALANRRDNLHEQAKRIRTRLAKEQQAILTSEWVLVEFLNPLQRPPARTLACQMVEQLRQSRRVRILPVSTEDWQRGYRLYQERPDKVGLSLIASPYNSASRSRFEKSSPRIETLPRLVIKS